ncbi:hypothetical protein [Ekhidna sp.]|uniref:hypothetical protein n=1 Tax=Ekhidna sp. TaxID=2608089 RepID=UPI003B5B9EEF
MKVIGKIAMTIAVCMLMLHTLMPHHHVNQETEDEHAVEYTYADSLLDYIKLALHLNPGENHLEEFEKTSNLTVYFPVAEIPTFEIPLCVECDKDDSFPVESSVLAKDHLVFLSISFRGPPQLG